MYTSYATTTTTTPAPQTLQTSLYDLIATLHDEVGEENDELIVATVMHLLQSGRIKFVRETSAMQTN